MSPKRVVLVTGGAGFVGSNLVDELIAREFKVRVIDNFATGSRKNLNPRAELIEADIRDGEAIRSAFHGIDCVFHVAALPRIPLSIARPVETHMTNVVGTLNVLIAARDAKVRRVIYSGSSSVYGDQTVMPLVETMTPNPLNPYALQKYVGEQYTRMFHRLFAMETLTLRYFNVYGPRMASEGAYVTVISAFMAARRRGEPLQIHGDGEQTRDFTHVSDIVAANILAMDASDGRRARHQYRRRSQCQHQPHRGPYRRSASATGWPPGRHARYAGRYHRAALGGVRGFVEDGIRSCSGTARQERHHAFRSANS